MADPEGRKSEESNTNPPKTEAPELNSPACAMRAGDDVYMGYAGKDELVAFLNTLLEAERAGARVALESAREASAGDAPTPVIADLMHAVQRDEARWCAMLSAQITALGAAPSSVTGDFHGKAMAITDMKARIAFLNRGQAWVVRKLREMLPRVRDDRLHADLTAMLKAHEDNIARAGRVIDAG
jgi:hypothetical protein